MNHTDLSISSRHSIEVSSWKQETVENSDQNRLRFNTLYILLPFSIWFLLFFIISIFDLHLEMANYIYQLEGGQWALKHHWLTTLVFHSTTRLINFIAVLCLLLYTLKSRLFNASKNVIKANLFLIIALLTSFACVGIVKAISNMDCPWDLSLYGGAKPYYSVFQSKPSVISVGRCFPAGHASIGFAWLSLFFYCKVICPKLEKPALVLSLSAGITLGFVQQLRGAHFVIDDLTTLIICWLCSAFTYRLMYSEQFFTANSHD